MEIPPALLQFLGSLAAILLLSALVWWLKLGPERPLDSDEAVRAAAQEAMDGFEAVDIARDRQNRAALACDAQGRVMVLRQHGTHFAARVLGLEASVTRTQDTLRVDTAERRFGHVSLQLDDACVWEERILALNQPAHA